MTYTFLGTRCMLTLIARFHQVSSSFCVQDQICSPSSAVLHLSNKEGAALTHRPAAHLHVNAFQSLQHMLCLMTRTMKLLTQVSSLPVAVSWLSTIHNWQLCVCSAYSYYPLLLHNRAMDWKGFYRMAKQIPLPYNIIIIIIVIIIIII